MVTDRQVAYSVDGERAEIRAERKWQRAVFLLAAMTAFPTDSHAFKVAHAQSVSGEPFCLALDVPSLMSLANALYAISEQWQMEIVDIALEVERQGR